MAFTEIPVADVLAMEAQARAKDASKYGITKEQPVSSEDDEDSYLPVGTLRRQYLDYLAAKSLEIEEQKQARHYYHGAQWSAEDIRILRARRQPVVTYNRTARKVNGICGIVGRQRQDPKGFPRSPDGEHGAEIATASVRYVLDANDWRSKEEFTLRQAAIDGISGVELRLIEGDQGDPDVGFVEVFADDYFYDPRSVHYDFSDARYHGLAKWCDEDEACELFPDKADLIRGLVEAGSDLTTYADREHKWILTNERRVRLVEHWYRHKGKVCWAFYISNTLLDQGASPFRDEKKKPSSRFIMFSAAVDHDGDRYGFIRNLKGMQDEINQRRSRGLHISASRRLIMEKGAVDDVEITRREWGRADGIIETNPAMSIKADDTTQDLAAQFQWLEEAKNEMESFANVNPATYSQGLLQNLSGRAINLLQQPGLAELGPFILAWRGFKIRLYRAIWNAVQQNWTAPRWIRVTDDKNLANFFQVNGLGLDQFGRPALVNAIGQLDVDIILDEGPDVVNMMQDTFDVLKGYPAGTIPPQVLIELAPMPGSQKQKILQMMQPHQDPMANQAKMLALASAVAKINRDQSTAELNNAKAGASQATALYDIALSERMLQNADAETRHTHAKADSAHADTLNTHARTAMDVLQAMNEGAQGGQGTPRQGRPQPSAEPSFPAAFPLPQGGGPNMAGMRKAPDGRNYVPDPNRPGKYLMVA